MSQKSEARRAHILQAAVRCFIRDGFHGASMKEVCTEAGVSPGIVYHYFDSKDAIIAALAQQERETMFSFMRQVKEAPTLRAALTLLADEYLNWLSEPGQAILYVDVTLEAARQPAVARLTEPLDNDFLDAVIELLRAAQTRGEIPATDPTLQTANAMGALLEGFILRAVVEPDPRQHRDTLKTALLRLAGLPNAA